MPSFPAARSSSHAGRCHSRPRDGGQTSAEFLVIAGLIVATIIAIMLTFRTQLSTAITTLGCKISSAANGQSGGCGAGGPGSGTTGGGTAGPFGLVSVPSSGVPPGPTGTLVRLPPKNAIYNQSSPTKWKWAKSQFIWDQLWKGEDLDKVTTRYGNWYGPGWWGGAEMDNRPGLKPPVDWLDAAAQKHDFGYQIAEEYGKIMGEQEKFRLMALADLIAARDAARLPEDPRDWVPPPKDIEEARRYRDRMLVGFSEVWNRWNNVQSLPIPIVGTLPDSMWYPVPNYGPLDLDSLERLQNARVEKWDREYLTRNPGMR